VSEQGDFAAFAEAVKHLGETILRELQRDINRLFRWICSR
jgi:hypothetical protein